MAKGASKPAAEELEGQEISPVNADELEHALYGAERRALEIQAKLHRWASDDPRPPFHDPSAQERPPGKDARSRRPPHRATKPPRPPRDPPPPPPPAAA